MSNGEAENTERIANVFYARMLEKTVGMVRHIFEKNMGKIPVGFSMVFYEPDMARKWSYDLRVVIDGKDPDLQNQIVRERTILANQFLSEAIKRIYQGELDDMIEDRKETDCFQIPGMKGKA